MVRYTPAEGIDDRKGAIGTRWPVDEGCSIRVEKCGGEARIRDLFAKAEPKLNLSDYERAPYEKSGWIRWKAIVHFYSIDCVKAGYIRKSGGRWYLTEDGERALHLPPEEFIRSAQAAYRAWKMGREKPPEVDTELTAAEQGQIVRQAAYEEALAQARAEIEEYINNLGAYDFQKLVAELLRAMGYYVPYVSSPGRDGGIDIGEKASATPRSERTCRSRVARRAGGSPTPRWTWPPITRRRWRRCAGPGSRACR